MLDPLSPLLQWQLGRRYFYKKQYDRAIEHFRNALELDPQYSQAYLMRGVIYVLIGRFEEGIQACETAIRIGGRDAILLANLGTAYATAGRIDDAKKLLDELYELARKTYISPMALAYICILLGETDNAFDWQEKAVDDRDGMIINILVVHIFPDPLRYHALLRKMNRDHSNKQTGAPYSVFFYRAAISRTKRRYIDWRDR